MEKEYQPGKDPLRQKHLMEGLQRHPELMERFEAILELAEAKGEVLLNANEIEERLIQEVRQLGNQTMKDWAREAEARVAKELKQTHPKARPLKKSPELVVCLRRSSY
jgi:hypothetical protein